MTPALDIAAGAVLIGKTHLLPLAFGITGENPDYGDCVQPADPGAFTGGSSSGAAASVQEGSAVAAIGTDTGGSIRVPAHFCGVFGHKPTWGLCPGRGQSLVKTAAMTDIAVNQNGDLWGVTGHDVYPLTVQGNNVVHCGKVIHLGASSPTFYALSFAPVGVIDPAKEVLVAGNTAGELWMGRDEGRRWTCIARHLPEIHAVETAALRSTR